MGFTIGMPSMKLSNVQGKGGKHCGNFTKVAKEALIYLSYLYSIICKSMFKMLSADT